MARKLPVEIWSDVVCPWCYVGKRRFEAALARFAHKDAVEITWRSFELDPRAPRSHDGSGDYATRLAKKYGRTVPVARQMLAQMTATAAHEGLAFDFGKAQPGNTFDAHRLLHFAGKEGKQGALKERLLRATFTDGEPIADREALVRLAVEVGLDEARARAVLASAEFGDAVRADEDEAREIGIGGVPFFAIDGKFGVSGAQSPDVLLEVLEKAWAAGDAEFAAGPACDAHACDALD